MGFGGIGQIIGDVTGGLLQYEGQRQANDAMMSSAREQMNFQYQALRNRHQWEVEDLKKAGLNPVLSADAGGPVPSGAGFDSKNVLEGPASAARDLVPRLFELFKMRQDIDVAKASKEKTEADTAVAGETRKVQQALALKTAAEATSSAAQAERELMTTKTWRDNPVYLPMLHEYGKGLGVLGTAAAPLAIGLKGAYDAYEGAVDLSWKGMLKAQQFFRSLFSHSAKDSIGK